MATRVFLIAGDRVCGLDDLVFVLDRFSLDYTSRLAESLCLCLGALLASEQFAFRRNDDGLGVGVIRDWIFRVERPSVGSIAKRGGWDVFGRFSGLGVSDGRK